MRTAIFVQIIAGIIILSASCTVLAASSEKPRKRLSLRRVGKPSNKVAEARFDRLPYNQESFYTPV